MDQEQSRFMTTVKLGPKSQIVIPKEVRDMFGIAPGDSLVLMADRERGIGIQKAEVLETIAESIFSGDDHQEPPHRASQEDRRRFAEEIRRTMADKEMDE